MDNQSDPKNEAPDTDPSELSPEPEGLSPEVERAANVTALVAMRESVQRRIGRPRKVASKPTVTDLAYQTEKARKKAEFIDNDPIVKATGKRDPIATLQKIKEEVAREAAAIHFARIEAEAYGPDLAQMSTRRIAALRDIASIELEIRKLGASLIDLKSEGMQKIFGMFIEAMKEAASEVLVSEQVDLLFNRLESKLDNWEERAMEKLR